LPRGFGPNVDLAYYGLKAAFGDWTAQAKLQQDYGKTPVEWILPRAFKKATGISHKSLKGQDEMFRYLPVRPYQEPRKFKTLRIPEESSRSSRRSRRSSRRNQRSSR
jgi:hypothetical protein